MYLNLNKFHLKFSFNVFIQYAHIYSNINVQFITTFFLMLFLCLIFYLNRNLNSSCFVNCYKFVLGLKFIIVLNLFYRNKPYR